MTRFIYSLLSAFLFLVGTFETVSSQQETIRMLFTSTSGSCTETELIKIDECFATTYTARRNLRSSNETIVRELSGSAYPTICATLCAGQVRGRCRTNYDVNDVCNGYRRRRDNEQQRELNLSCDTLRNNANSCLNTLRSSSLTSPSCKAFIGDASTRPSTCHPRLEWGSVTDVRLWSIASTGNTVLQSSLPVSGYSVCKSLSINLESINDPCVRKAYMFVSGPSGFGDADRTEIAKPYTVFGDVNGKLNGRMNLPVGTYTFSITPDDDVGRKKTWSFNIINC